MIRTNLLVFCNAVKGGVDKYSKAMKDLARNNVAENPIVSILGRLISSQVSNCAVVHRLYLVEETGKLSDTADQKKPYYRGYGKSRKRVSSCETFRSFVRDLAREWI